MGRGNGRDLGEQHAPALTVLLMAAAMAVAAALAFVSGTIVSKDVAPLPADAAGVIGICAAGLVIAQLWVQLLVLARAARATATAARNRRDLAGRNEQLWLLGRLCEVLGRENRPRRIAGRALDFFIEEIGASRAVYWRADVNGEPVGPSLARSPGGQPDPVLRLTQTERSILARNAARRASPIVVPFGAAEPARLDAAAAPSGPFTLFLPLSAEGAAQGVLEIEANGIAWSSQRWDVVGVLTFHVAVALERGRRYEEMQQQADEDFTTGLYNHRFMQSYLQRLLGMAGRRNRRVAVLFLDVDDFKTINDSLGHGAGDRVLQAVADQLRLMTDRVGVVGRSGGDEFMVVLPGHGRAEADAFAQAFQDWLAAGPPAVKGLFRLKVSCGVAIFPDDADNRQELLAAADARLYRAKDKERRSGQGHSGNGAGERTLGVYGLLDQLVDTIHRRDNYTRDHCERTAEYAVLLAQRLGLSPSVQRTVRLAGLLHDVGKIGVPEGILRKAGPLSDEEFEIVKHQLNMAGHLIADIPNAGEVRKVVRHSHERWDGTGYPDGLKGEEVPYLARVLAVADTYAAITMDRPYRTSVPGREAYAELRAVSGTQLDPRLVHAFIDAMAADIPPVAAGAAAPFDQAAAS